MKKNIGTVFLTILMGCLLLGFQACKKKSPEPSRSALITRTWKVKQLDATVNGTTTTLFQEGAASNTENYSAFRLNFTDATTFKRTEKDGTTTTNGTWQFKNNESQIELTNTGSTTPQIIDIVELNGNSFIYHYSETNNKGQTQVLRFQMVPL